MPTYPVINKETGETKELSMSMVAYGESVSYTHLTLPTTPYV